MNSICIIPARSGSVRIKNKNIAKINNKPLIEYTLNAAIKIVPLDNIFISTNDQKIINIAKKFKINFIKRPKNLCTDSSSSESGLIHAIKIVEKEKKFDHVIFLQVTSPLRNSDDIIGCIRKYKKKD